MTVSEWIKENKKYYTWCDFIIVDEEKHIILDDKIGYLPNRDKEYNKEWRSKCRGKQVVAVENTRKGIMLVIR